jgi:hypothetical protein
MGKKKIKFSHWYHKFDNVLNSLKGASNTADLLLVAKLPNQMFYTAFLEYDTAYEDKNYELPDSEYYLLLIFKSDYSSLLFPTIRRYTDQKYKYYMKSIGEEFVIEIKGGKNGQ